MNTIGKNQYPTNPSKRTHIENYYKIYVLLFCLAISFLLIRQIIKKSSKVHRVDINSDLEETDLQKVDWLEIQKSLGTILGDIQKCFDLSWISQTNLIFPFKLIKHPLFQKFTILNEFQFKGIQLKDRNCHLTRKIDNWEIKISSINIILSNKKTTITLGCRGSWSVSQGDLLSVNTDTDTFCSQTFQHKSFTFSERGITFYDENNKTSDWVATDENISDIRRKQLLSFFTNLQSAIKPDLRNLIKTLNN